MVEPAAKRQPTGRHKHPPRTQPDLPRRSEIATAAQMFEALGDPARLKLLFRLSHVEICVSELADLDGERLTTVSARLKSLHAARLVKRRRQAKHIYYSIADDHVLQMISGAIAHAAERPHGSQDTDA